MKATHVKNSNCGIRDAETRTFYFNYILSKDREDTRAINT